MKINGILVLLAVAGLILLQGCLQVENNILVRKDGTALVTQKMSVAMGAEGALYSLLGMQAPPVGTTVKGKAPLLGLDSAQLAMQAAKIAPGAKVKSFKSTTEKKTGTQTIWVEIAVPDVRTLDIQALLGSKTQDSAQAPARIGFESGKPGRFYLVTPGHSPAVAVDTAKSVDSIPEARDPMEQMAQMMALQMLKGLKMKLSLSFEGAVTGTNAVSRKGNSIALLDLDFDRVLQKVQEDPAAPFVLPSGLEDAKKMSGTFPGIAMETADSLWVEFQ